MNMNIKKITLSLMASSLFISLQANACLTVPIPGTTITSNFGLRFHPVHKKWKPHRGTDMRAAMYTPILAANSGNVIFSGWLGGGGNVIKIEGDDGVQTDYLHLSKAAVNVGTRVTAGEKIALSGNTGHASAAPHLHFQVRTENGTRLVDPKPLLCSTLPEKPGAGPARTSPDGYPAPTVSTNGSNPTSSPAGGGSAISSNISMLSTYEGMSEMDVMKSESERRFLNPEWHLRMSSCDTDYLKQEITGELPILRDCKMSLYKEAVSLNMFSNWVKAQKMESLDRIESLLAIKNARKSKELASENLETIRRKLKSPKASD